jgi:hypothetical protein
MPNLRLPLVIILLMFAGSAGAARAATYYVSAHGVDRSSGISPARAWKTVGRVNAQRLHPGDVVLFRGSDSFSDATLTPQASGTQRSPIVFGSYGGSRARLHHAGAAVWFKGVEHVTFSELDLTNDGTDGAVIAGSPSGGSGFISIERCRIHDTAGVGILSPTVADHSWLIARNVISRIGDSGLVILGAGDAIRHNVIADTGLNSAISWDKHGIYMKGRRAVIVGNTITNFQANGVSLRSSDALVAKNTIRGGPFGIAYFDFESQSGTSRILENSISGVRTGFYFSRDQDALSNGNPLENFVIRKNTVVTGEGAALDVTGARFSSISIIGNVIRGSFTTPVAAYSPSDGGRYVEGKNTVYGSGNFAWNGNWLAYSAYRAASGQGLGDRLYASS